MTSAKKIIAFPQRQVRRGTHELAFLPAALEIVETHPGSIDLLVTDAVMPGRSGIDLVREPTTRQPGLPVILMSGYTQDTLPIRDLSQAITLLQKPFTPRDLRHRIRAILDR